MNGNPPISPLMLDGNAHLLIAKRIGYLVGVFPATGRVGGER